jgi:DNA-binding SARP family transcriptional activator
MAQQVRIDVCGHLAVTTPATGADDTIYPQWGLLLAYLALHRSRPVSREQLVLALWGDDAGGDHRATFNSLLSKVRARVGERVIENRGRTSVQLAANVKVDFHEAVADLEAAQAALARGALEDACAAAERALAVADRGVLEGETSDWLEEPRRELHDVALAARECIAEAARLQGGGRVSVAVRRAREVVTAEPFRESAYDLLMRALAAEGNLAEAIGVYEQCRTRLDELALIPSDPLRRLHAELLTATPMARPAARTAAPAPLQPAMLPRARPRTQTTFVGRENELRQLQRTFDEVAAGQCRLVLVDGDPGIGKTRLAGQFADACAGEAVTLYGRCDSQTSIPYEPFIEAVRRQLTDDTIVTLREAIPQYIDVLGLVLPELEGARPAVAAFEETERLRLFEAMAMVLRTLALERPVVLVIDDLHWADKPTLLMLRQIVRYAATAPVMMIATYRRAERSEELTGVLVDLRREHFFERVRLDGLDVGSTADMLRELGDAGSGRSHALTLWEETRGNPFFLEEMLRHRHTTEASDGDAVPESVREILGERLARLARDVRRILEIASVVGTDFSVEILEALCPDVPEERLFEALGEAVEARLIREVRDTYGWFTFEHALTHQALLEGMGATWRARRHLRVGELLERLGQGGRDGPQLAELVHHFLHAPPAEGLPKALTYAKLAAEREMTVFAFEEAVRHYGVALSVVEQLGGDAAEREALLLGLGEAQVRAGEVRTARQTFGAAVEIARQRGSARGMALAALGVGAGQMAAGMIDRRLVALLEEALAAVGDSDDVLRARMLARLGIELSFAHEQRDERVALSAEAVAVARASGDSNALSAALHSRHWSLWEPENLAERLQIATEMLEVARATGDRRIEMEGHRWLMMDLLEVGDMEAVDGELAAYAERANERRRPAELWYTHLYAAMRFLFAGQYAEAQRESRAAFELGSRVDDSNAHGFTLQMAVLARDVGRLTEFEGAVRDNVDRYPAIPGWNIVLAIILLDTDRTAEAREAFERMAADDFAPIPRDGSWMGAMTYSAELAVALGQRPPAGAARHGARPL